MVTKTIRLKSLILHQNLLSKFCQLTLHLIKKDLQLIIKLHLFLQPIQFNFKTGLVRVNS